MVILFGLPTCGKCLKAEEKLKLLGIEYRKVNLDFPDPEDRMIAADAMTEYALNETLPLLLVNGQIVDYPTAMQLLKSQA